MTVMPERAAERAQARERGKGAEYNEGEMKRERGMRVVMERERWEQKVRDDRDHMMSRRENEEGWAQLHKENIVGRQRIDSIDEP